jgi:VanZ family protein
MCLMFGMSTDIGSSNQSSRFIGPVLKWFVPNISPQAIAEVQYYVRKTAHLVEYGVLTMLLWRAIMGMSSTAVREKIIVLAWAGAVVFAISDELHQSLYSSRTASAWDVFLDSCGAGVAALLIFLCRNKKAAEE